MRQNMGMAFISPPPQPALSKASEAEVGALEGGGGHQRLPDAGPRLQRLRPEVRTGKRDQPRRFLSTPQERGGGGRVETRPTTRSSTSPSTQKPEETTPRHVGNDGGQIPNQGVQMGYRSTGGPKSSIPPAASGVRLQMV